MSHYLHIEKDGELVDLIPFCSDWCHRSYCSAYGVKYDGWNGCHENSDTPEDCFYCDEPIHGGWDEE